MRQLSGKGDLRRELLAARRTMSTDQRRAADAAIVSAVTALATARGSSVAAGYRPMAAEPGGPALLDALSAAVQTIMLPVLLPDRDLDWAGYPDGEPLGVTAIGRADLVLVPAVAVGQDGVRLGRGGGSYDRALTRVGARALVVALLYDGELRNTVPAQPHDRPVDGVIRPSSGLLLIRSR
jgi:5-formyltetrahydrofolate cyclo-ligase